MILVDRRIGSVEIQPRLKSPSLLVEMEFGDMMWEGKGPDGVMQIGVERKRIRDLVNSIASGRLAAHQLPGLRGAYDVVYLVVEGVWKGDRSGELVISRDGGRTFFPITQGRKWGVESVWHFLMSVEVMAGVKVRMTRDEKDTARQLDSMYVWWQKEWGKHKSLDTMRRQEWEKGVVGFDPREVVGVPSLVRRVAKELPHIDTGRSKAVDEFFPSVVDMVNAPEKVWMAIPGVGKTTARDVWCELRKRRR